MSEQGQIMTRGFHMVVATPGRLQDMLEKKKFTLTGCKYLCLDEVCYFPSLLLETAANPLAILVRPIG